MPPKFRSELRRRLLHWYRRKKRDLPWRRTRDPYAIWISETMLQQTRVAVVIPYYERFLGELPDIETLARARLARVLRLWAGLGYYRRAENLHKAARQIVRRHGGTMPRDFTSLRALTGIGEYTAGALLSIAFGAPYPAIDGNVRRVIARLTGDGDPNRLRTLVADLIPPAHPGEFNQALMELGVTVCTPKNQLCSACALRSLCASQNSAATAPVRSKRIKFESVIWPLAIIRRRNKILLHRRNSGGLLGGLWELPGAEMKPRETVAALLGRHTEELDGQLPRGKKLGVIHHAITHRRIRAPIYLFDLDEETSFKLPKPSWRWVDRTKLQSLATSSMTAKAGRLLVAHEKALR